MQRRSFIKSVLSALGALFAPAFVPRKADATMYLAPFVPTVVAPAQVHDIVQLGYLSGDGPNWLQASGSLVYPWNNAGGDYLDSVGVSNGSTHFASASEPAQVEGLTAIFTGGTPTSGLVKLINKLRARNTAFCLNTSGTTSSAFHGKDTVTPPALHIVMSTGATFDPPCIVNCYGTASSAYCLPDAIAETRIFFPAFLKFDLSGVDDAAGYVTSATLTLTYGNIYQVGHTIYADYLDLPTLVHDPARQLGGVQRGLADTVSIDTALNGTSGVAWYPRMDSDANIRADWNSIHPIPPPLLPVCIDPHYVTTGGWEKYGLTALRMGSDYIGNTGAGAGYGVTILSWRQAVTNADKEDGPGPAMGTTEYNELWVRYLLKVDKDVYLGLNEIGVKLPGMEGFYGSSGLLGGYSARMFHRNQSAANQQAYRFAFYLYDAENRFNAPSRGLILDVNACLEGGKIHCIEQHIKKNTINHTVTGTDPYDGTTYQTAADGILEAWVDGVKVYSRTNFVINDIDPDNPQIGKLFANVYHGGTATPKAQIHYEFGGVCAATSYIGPPKVQAPYTIPAQGHFKNISLNNMIDVEACPTHNCPYWESAGVGGIFFQWCGGAYDRDYSTLGALLVHGGGHLPTGYQGNEVYAFNLTTALWECCRKHPSPYIETQIVDTQIGAYPDGQPAASHTYAMAEAMPASWFGGSKGKFLKFGFGGNAQVMWAMDLNNTPEAYWTRFGPSPITIISNLATYNMVVRDDAREGFWLCTSGGADRTLFINKDGRITAFMVYNSFLGRGGIAYSPSLDLLIVKSGSGSGPTVASLSVMRADNPAAGWFDVNWTGTGPGGMTFGTQTTAPGYGDWEQCGITWSTILGKFVSYVGSGQSIVYFLTPPADPINGTWVWTSETLVGDSGAVPSNNGQPNGHWGGRFREVPALRSFVWADDAAQPVQLWRPTGMV